MLILKVQNLHKAAHFLILKLWFSNQHAANEAGQSDDFVRLCQTRDAGQHREEERSERARSAPGARPMLLGEGGGGGGGAAPPQAPAPLHQTLRSAPPGL